MKKILILTLIISLSGCAWNKSEQDLPEPQLGSMEAPEMPELPSEPILSDQIVDDSMKDKPMIIESSGQDAPIQLGYDTNSAAYQKVVTVLKNESPSESIAAFHIPESEQKLYFATSGNEEFDVFSETYFSTLKVYSYDLNNDQLEVIFDQEQDIYHRVLGLDGQNLILASYLSPDYSPGRCSSPWLDPNISLMSLDIDNPQRIEPYTAPQTMIERETSIKEQCLKIK